MKKTSLTIIASLTLGVPLAGQAQEVFDNRFYLTPFGSYTLGDDDRQSKDGWGGGVAIGRPINPHWNIELREAYEQLDQESDLFFDENTGTEIRGDIEFKNLSFGIDALFFFNRQGFQPFLLAGIGAIRDKATMKGLGVNVDDSAWSFMANAGAGFLFPFNDTVALRADARYRWDDNQGDLVSNGSYNDWVFTLGVQFALGEKPRAAAPPAPEPVAAPAPPVRKIELSADALFAFDKATLTPQGESSLDELLRDLRSASVASIQVIGHTDPLGSDSYNLQLSEQRAHSVASYLVSHGVPAEHIRAEGRGETELKVTPAECKDARGRRALIACYQPNRRVEVMVTGQAG